MSKRPRRENVKPPLRFEDEFREEIEAVLRSAPPLAAGEIDIGGDIDFDSMMKSDTQNIRTDRYRLLRETHPDEKPEDLLRFYRDMEDMLADERKLKRKYYQILNDADGGGIDIDDIEIDLDEMDEEDLAFLNDGDPEEDKMEGGDEEEEDVDYDEAEIEREIEEEDGEGGEDEDEDEDERLIETLTQQNYFHDDDGESILSDNDLSRENEYD